MLSIYLIFFLGFIAPNAFGENSRQKPLREGAKRQYYICDECVPRELVMSPGIGFDLSSSYGTAAIRYHNGTVVDIGRIDGGAEYKEFMARLSAPWKRYGPPFETPLDQIEYDLDQAQRQLRRLRGLPSTRDISTLSFMLYEMTRLVLLEIHMSTHKIVLSLPYMPNFQAADLEEAMHIAGLTNLHTFRYYGEFLHNMNAAWAGMGNGICEHWQNTEKCDEEIDQFKMTQALALTYTYDELVIEVMILYGALHGFRTERIRFPDLSYGTWDLDRSNKTYWETIGRKVAEVFKKSTYPGRIKELVLMGEYAEEKRFLDSVWKGLGGGMEAQKLWAPLQKTGFRAEYMAARGAAEMAKRWQGEAWNCVEGDWCKGNRDEEALHVDA